MTTLRIATGSLRLARLAPLLGLACLMAAGAATAALRPANLGLAANSTACSGPGSYGYQASWRGGPGAGFTVHTGNQCVQGAAICGISTRLCAVKCNAQGACSVGLTQCLAGKGGPWLQVVAVDGSGYQRIATPAPGRCN
ncbi:MAG: hypothetical protein MUF16_06555 [Burkholderiaceae bacterium]|jgi:hypothetical protein|nr:hypothetical protein [Burkholderiaceae bacterium]